MKIHTWRGEDDPRGWESFGTGRKENVHLEIGEPGHERSLIGKFMFGRMPWSVFVIEVFAPACEHEVEVSLPDEESENWHPSARLVPIRSAHGNRTIVVAAERVKIGVRCKSSQYSEAVIVRADGVGVREPIRASYKLDLTDTSRQLIAQMWTVDDERPVSDQTELANRLAISSETIRLWAIKCAREFEIPEIEGDKQRLEKIIREADLHGLFGRGRILEDADYDEEE